MRFSHVGAVAVVVGGLTAVGVVAGTGPAGAAEGSVLERVKARGAVVCGVDQTPGFSGFSKTGEHVGFDVEFCRAIAAAVLGDPDLIEPQRVNTANKFRALVDGDIDVAFGMTTWTHARDTTLGTVFPTVLWYDGQGFMTWADSGVTSAGDLDGRTICVQSKTTSEANLRDYLKRRGITAEVLPAPSSDEKMNAFAERQCEVVTGDRSELGVRRAHGTAVPDRWVLLPETISREPLGPVVVQGDPQWFSIVRWATLVPIIAEARGVSAASLKAVTADAADGEIRRLAGLEPGFGEGLGLDPFWARRVVEAVGTFADIHARTLAPLGLERGQNALWTDGGLHYAPPLR